MTFTRDIAGVESMTPTRLIDRRTEGLPSATEIAALDTERKSKRAEVERQISAARLAEKRRLECVSAIESINQKKETLAAAHVEACSPLQRELSEIERQQIAIITNRQPTDSTLDNRRKDLISQLRSLNDNLEEKIAHQDCLLASLETDRISEAKKCSTNLLENQLVELASSALRMKMRSTANIREHVERWRDSLRKDCVNYPREVARLQSELELVESILAKAAADADEAYADCINE